MMHPIAKLTNHWFGEGDPKGIPHADLVQVEVEHHLIEGKVGICLGIFSGPGDEMIALLIAQHAYGPPRGRAALPWVGQPSSWYG